MPGGALHKQVTLITGAGRGVGRAIALRFAKEGARVVICARTKREIQQVAKDIRAAGGTVMAQVTDISKPEAVRRLLNAITRRFGRVDILINNAGTLGPRIPLADYSTREWTRVIAVNLTGTFLVAHAALALMIPERAGCILSISSSVGRKGRAGWGAYSVSKFGVESLTQTLAEELRPLGIRAMTYNPGGTRTRMRAEAYPHENPASLRDPAEAAHAVLRLVLHTSMAHSGLAFDRESLPGSHG